MCSRAGCSWLYRVGSGGAPDAQTTVIEAHAVDRDGAALGAYLIFGPTPTNPTGAPYPRAFDEGSKMLYISYRLDQLDPMRALLARLELDQAVHVYFGRFGETTWAEVQAYMHPLSPTHHRR
jgi:hypothetical protein